MEGNIVFDLIQKQQINLLPFSEHKVYQRLVMGIFVKVLGVLTQIQHDPSFTQNGDFVKGYSPASTSIFNIDKEINREKNNHCISIALIPSTVCLIQEKHFSKRFQF